MFSQFINIFAIQVHSLISSTPRHKLLVLTGQSLEDSGDLVLHTGQFTPNDFTQIFSDEEVCHTVNVYANNFLCPFNCPHFSYGFEKLSIFVI